MVRYVKRRAYAKRKSPVKRMAKGKSTSITKLAKSIVSLQRQVRSTHKYLNFAQTWNGAGVQSNYTFFPLSKFSAWSLVFGTTANDTNFNTVHWSSSFIDMKIDIGNEPANVNFTVMLLKCKDVAKGLIDSNGDLSLIGGDAFYTQSGLTLVNRKYFSVLATRRFSLGNHGQASSTATAQTQYGTDRRYTFKLRPNKKIVNPSGDWINMNQCQDPSGNYYLVVFNDNSALDLEFPQVWMNAIHTIRTV